MQVVPDERSQRRLAGRHIKWRYSRVLAKLCSVQGVRPLPIGRDQLIRIGGVKTSALIW